VLLALRRDPQNEGVGGSVGARDLRGPGGFDVLKVAHHGSRLQDPALLAEVRAPVALITVGADNTYGHPAVQTLDLLESSGSQVFRTDDRGDIAVTRTSDGAILVSRPR
jgi:competence protein ComEC